MHAHRALVARSLDYLPRLKLLRQFHQGKLPHHPAHRIVRELYEWRFRPPRPSGDGCAPTNTPRPPLISSPCKECEGVSRQCCGVRLSKRTSPA